MRLSKNFMSKEFACPCCGGENISGELAFKLQALRDLVRKPIQILSGYRCEKYNREINGYIKSPHIGGLAADIYVGNFNHKKLAKLAEKVKFKRIGLYPFSHSKFIHVDVQPPKPNQAWIRWKNGKYVYYGTLKTAFKALLDYEEKTKFEVTSYP